MKTILLTFGAALVFLLPALSPAETSEDAYIAAHDDAWTLGSKSVEMTIALQNGMLATTHLKNKLNNHELAFRLDRPMDSGQRQNR